MAAPRIFVSSTFYDLRQIRADLEMFIRDMGYEPILHERGGVPYGSGEKLEEYAYREVELADILVSIVGSKFGSQSQHGGRSISQEELKRALDNNTQVYIFVEQGVLSEYQTYQGNKDIEGISWRFADDVRVYEHLEALHALPNNNTIQSFETAADITRFLRLQWAGLFHRFLQDQAKQQQLRTLEEMQTTVRTLDSLVEFLSAERREEAPIREILGANHPLFARVREVLNVRYPVFFRDWNELNRWLIDAENFRPIPEDVYDDADHIEWLRANAYLKINRAVFDEHGRIVPMDQETFDGKWVQLRPLENWEDIELDENIPMPNFSPSSVSAPNGSEAPRSARRAPTRRRARPPAGDDEA